MTVNVDPALVEAIELAAWVGTALAMLVIGMLVYLMVRPVRRREPPPPPEIGADRELLRLMQRMEQRLAILERAVADAAVGDRLFEAGGERPETRRRK